MNFSAAGGDWTEPGQDDPARTVDGGGGQGPHGSDAPSGQGAAGQAVADVLGGGAEPVGGLGHGDSPRYGEQLKGDWQSATDTVGGHQ